jgi:uncharacterized membrane protein
MIYTFINITTVFFETLGAVTIVCGIILFIQKMHKASLDKEEIRIRKVIERFMKSYDPKAQSNHGEQS